MKVWAILQPHENGEVNPYHIYKTKAEAVASGKQWFSHAPYQILEVDKKSVPKTNQARSRTE